MNAKRSKCFQVRLNARTAPAVGAGDGQGDGNI